MPDAKKQRAGRKGGQVVSQDRAHMAAIGRKGGQRSHLKRTEKQEGTKGGVSQHADSHRLPTTFHRIFRHTALRQM